MKRIDPPVFIQWKGGKRRLLGQLTNLLPDDFADRRYIEPFVGGGALFFHLLPSRALLCDAGPDLIGTYIAVRDNPEEVIRHLDRISADFSKPEYHRIRDAFNNRTHESNFERAAMFIYITKVGFQTGFCVNKSGLCNTSYGNGSGHGLRIANKIRAASEALSVAEIKQQSFEHLLSDAEPGDFVYMDPPYDIVKKTDANNYTSSGFNRDHQVELRDVFVELDKRGCKLMLSNSSTDFIRDIYTGYRIDSVYIKHSASTVSDARPVVEEIVVRNY